MWPLGLSLGQQPLCFKFPCTIGIKNAAMNKVVLVLAFAWGLPQIWNRCASLES